RQRLGGQAGPIVATSDFDSTQPDLIRPFLNQEFATLGADGFGFSDTRAAARRHFKIDAHSVVVRTLQLLADRGGVAPSAPADAAAPRCRSAGSGWGLAVGAPGPGDEGYADEGSATRSPRTRGPVVEGPLRGTAAGPAHPDAGCWLLGDPRP